MPIDKVRENRLRRQAQRLDLLLRRSRARYLHLDDFGDYMLIDPHTNSVVAGGKFDLSLDEVEAFLGDYEKAIRREMEQTKKAAA